MLFYFQIKEATAAWKAWDKTHASLLAWLSGAELRVSTNTQTKLEVGEKQQELDSLRTLMKEIRSHSSDIEELHEVAEQLISVCGHSSANELSDLSTRFEAVSKSAKVSAIRTRGHFSGSIIMGIKNTRPVWCWSHRC